MLNSGVVEGSCIDFVWWRLEKYSKSRRWVSKWSSSLVF